MSLASRLTTMKKNMTSKFKPGAPKIADAQALYLSVLTSVAFPILGSNPSEGNVKSPKLHVKPNSNSIPKDNTIFVCLSSMNIAHQKIEERMLLMKDINTIEAKVFLQTGQRALDETFRVLDTMTDLRTLIDQLGYFANEQLQQMLMIYPMSPQDADEYLYKTIELFLAIFKEVIYMENGVDYEVRKHPILRTHTLKNQVAKYFMTNSQLLQDNGSDLTISVRDLFGISNSMHATSLKTIQAIHSTGSVFKQLTTYLESIARGTCAGYMVEDFETPQDYAIFVERETKNLASILNAYGLLNPDAPGKSSTARIGVNMPLDMKTAERYYKVLVALCFDHDVAESAGSLTLSKVSKAILNECAIRWNICKEFKEAAIFDILVKKYAAGALSLNDLYPFFKSVLKMTRLVAGMRKHDKQYLLSSFRKLKISLNTQVNQFLGMVHYPSLEPEDCSGLLKLVVYMFEQIHSDPLCNQCPTMKALDDHEIEQLLTEEIKLSANERMEYTFMKIERAFPEKDQQLIRISKLVQSLSSDIKKYRAYFPAPILQFTFVYSVASESYLPTANRIVETIAQLDPETPMVEILELFNHVKEFYDLCEEVEVPSQLIIDIQSLFVPIINMWLTRTDNKWVEWVQRAYLLDDFEPLSTPHVMNSTSVLDLFSGFEGGWSFLTNFKLEDRDKRDQLKANFIKAMNKTLETYCKLIFYSFAKVDHNTNVNMVAFNKEHVIKLNNIMVAQKLFNDLLIEIDGFDKISGHVNPNSRIVEPETKSFQIKLIGAKNLSMASQTKAPDAFSILTLGNDIVGATDVIRKNPHPNWHSYFPIILSNELDTDSKAFLQISVCHDNPLGDEIPIGNCALFLRDIKVQNYLSHNINLTLRPQGSLSVRIRRDGEIEDTEWYIKRSQEILRFTIEDMIHTITGKIVRVLEAAVERIMKATQGTKLFGLALTKEETLSDESIEGYLMHEFDYIDSVLTLLNQYSDRRFDRYFDTLYPNIGALKIVEADENETIEPALDTTLKPKQVNRGLLEEIVKKTYSIEYFNPPAFVHLIWHTILEFATAQLERYLDKLSNMEIRETRILDSLIEYLKSLFYCKVGKKNLGLAIHELETPLYRQVRFQIDSILNPAAE